MSATDTGPVTLTGAATKAPQEPNDLERLADLIEQTTGNVIPAGQYPYLEQVAREHAQEAGFSTLGPYLDLLEADGAGQEWQRLLPDVTIKESSLFRIPEQFRGLTEEILPRLARTRPDTHTLRVWSAGCARGEEPATLAVVLAECPFLANRRWEVLATDVDAKAIADARRGRFGARAMARVPPLLLRTWFDRREDEYVLAPELLGRIEYRDFNIFRSPFLSLGAAFDIIFLRNVLIYFSPESQRRVVSRVVSRLAPDGYLFLGHSESLWQLNDEMEPLELGNCFAYRRRRPPPEKQRRIGSAVAAPPVTDVEAGHERAGREIVGPAPVAPNPELRPAPPAFVPPAAPAPVPPSSVEPRHDLGGAAAALVEDRLDDARAIVDHWLEEHKASAEAHALSGLLHDLRGEAEAAVAAYRKALYLEPGLFQVRFLLAHRLEHLSWMARARQEYRRVLTDLGRGQSRELDNPGGPLGGRGTLLKRLLPTRPEAAQRCRRALGRI